MTIGPNGGRFLLVAPGWQGQTLPGIALYRASTPHLWVSMRVLAQSQAEVADARRFQDASRLFPASLLRPPVKMGVPPAPAAGSGRRRLAARARSVLRADRHLPPEEASVRRFRPLGVLAERPFDASTFDPAALAAIESGYKDATALVEILQNPARRADRHRLVEGEQGQVRRFNYIRRAGINAAGLGANLPEENSSFTTFVDHACLAEWVYGQRLDSPFARRLRCESARSARTQPLHHAVLFKLYPVLLRRYLVNDRTPGLKTAPDGSVEIRIQHDQAKQANWLPAPAGPSSW